jgi:hypothetical protein
VLGNRATAFEPVQQAARRKAETRNFFCFCRVGFGQRAIGALCQQEGLAVPFRAKAITSGPLSRARVAVSLMAIGLSLAVPQQPASAQGLFETLFGGLRLHRPAPLPPQTSSYADPQGLVGRESRPYAGNDSGSSGHGMAFCVRTCDGRYFPLQRQAGRSPAETCRAFCPASKTVVFSGSKIDYAVASDGTRYADLENAFAYRQRVVGNCTCNGRDALGLAPQDVASDPTLRPGDIVATNDGLMSYRGRSSKTAQFTPIDASSGALSRQLSAIRVRPTPPTVTVKTKPLAQQDAASPDRRDQRRVQLSR